MAAAIQLDIGGNTARLDRDIQKTVNKAYTINLKTKGEQPLGRITGKVNEFNKSLDASNARVIAFGASAGIIFGVQRAFEALVASTIDVQKSLAEINVILNVSTKDLASFGGELFKIARNTGQSFDEVAKAATEFSRQGLGVTETLKRTNEALILSRLSGLDAAKSVNALTAAVNSFASQAVTATEIVNKFATVDAAFAVSSADLADAISRVGSSASQSGVSLNELIAIVTSAQQTTARGGAVIGNSFKTIFTRLQREKVVDLLESLGISKTDSSGQLKSTIQLLQDLAGVYDKLGATQQAAVAEQVGGVFQINILKAALADLGKEYSIYNSALNVAAGATDQAVQRNEELNKTYASQLNALQENAKQLAATAGQRLIGPSFERVVGGANELLGGINESDGQGVGAILGKGILDGLGQLLAGPGLALIGGVLLKLFKDFGKFATGSIKELLGLNTATKQQADLQKSINQILSKNPQLLQLMLQGEQGLNAAAQQLLTNFKLQTVELQKQEILSARVAAQLYKGGVRVTDDGLPVITKGKPGKAAGYIPNFAQGDFAREELLAASLGAKNPKAQLSKGTIDGKKFIKNNREVEITGFGSNGDSAVIPNYAKGFIPNFAKFNIGGKAFSTAQIPNAIKTGNISEDQARQAGYLSTKEKQARPKTSARPTKDIAQLLGFKLPTILTPSADGGISRTRQDLFPDGTDGQFNFQAFGIKSTSGLKDDFENIVGKNNFIDKFINDNVLPFASKIASVVKAPPVEPNTFQEIKGAKGFRSSIEGALGGIFDAAITTAIGLAGGDPEKGDFDVRTGGAQKTEYINELFGSNALGGRANNLGDFKKNVSPDAAKSMIDKTIKEYGADIQAKYKSTNIQKKAAGYIPNFAAIQDAVSRERAAGIPSSQIYLAQEQALTSANPMGLGVFNKKDEPTKGSRRRAISNRGYARGYIPNFAETPETAAANTTSAVTAIGIELTTLALLLRSNSGEYKESLQKLTKANVEGLKKQKEAIKTGLAASNKTGVRQQPGAILSAQKQSADIDKQIAKAEKGSFGQRSKAFAKGGGLGGLGFAAPILAQTATQFIPQNTQSGRVASSAVGGLGQVASFAATGALFGPIGAAVGAAAGALLTIPDIVSQATTNFPELQANAEKASQELTKFSEAGARIQTAYESLQTSIANPNASQDAIAKASDAYAQALSELSVEDQKRIESAAKVGKLEEEYAKILAEKSAAVKSTETAAAAGQLAGESNKSQFLGTAARVGFGIASLGASELTGAGASVQGLIAEGGTSAGTKGDKALQQQFQSALLQGKTGKAAIKGLEQAGGTDFVKQLGGIQTGDIGALEDLLNKVIPEQEGKADYITSLIDLADNNAVAFGDVVGSLGQSFLKAKDAAEQNVKTSDAAIAASQKETLAKEQASKSTEKIIANLETNIRVAQRAADAQRALAQAQIQFQRNTSFADTFTRPTETVSTLVGEGAPLAESFKLREEVAGIGLKQANGIEAVKSTFVNDINESIKGAFGDAVSDVRSKASNEGTSGDINNLNSQLSSLSYGIAGGGTSSGAFKEVQNILNEASGSGGPIKTDLILSKIEQTLTKANVKAETISKITQQVREAGDKGNNEIKLLKDASLKEFKTLAKEQTQKILIARIQQAQKFGGGIEEFINPPKPGESTFDKAFKNLETDPFGRENVPDGRFDYQSGSNEFKYNYPEAERARKEMAPEYGREALKTITSLQDLTGYTPDANGKAYQAAVDGLEEYYRQQGEELKKRATDKSLSPLQRDEAAAAYGEIDKLGGYENIAKIQVAQKTGSLTEAGYKEITGKFKDSNLEDLRARAEVAGGPELVAAINKMASESLISQDPTVNAIYESNSILGGILDAVGGQTQEKKFEEQVVAAELKKKEAGQPNDAAMKAMKPQNFDDVLADWSIRESASSGGKVPSQEQLKKSFPGYTGYMSPQSQKLAAQVKTPEQNNNFISSLQTNSTALTGLTSVIQSLQASIQNQISSTQQASNPTQGYQPQGQIPQGQVRGQQNANPTNNTTVGPFNVVVNQTQSNIEGQINQAMEQLRAEILRLVDVKVPPTTTPNRVQP